MFPSEMVVLMAIATANKAYDTTDARPVDMVSDYTSHLYESLIQRGFIGEAGVRMYRLTAKGRVVVCDFLYDNRTKARDIIMTLKEIGIDTRIRPKN